MSRPASRKIKIKTAGLRPAPSSLGEDQQQGLTPLTKLQEAKALKRNRGDTPRTPRITVSTPLTVLTRMTGGDRMKAETCPKCHKLMWVPAYEGDGAPPHYCKLEKPKPTENNDG